MHEQSEFEPSPPSPPSGPGRLVVAGVIGACALGAGLGLWARPGAQARPERPVAAPMQPAAHPALQIVVDDTPPPVGRPLEVLPHDGEAAAPAPAPELSLEVPSAPRPPAPIAPRRAPSGLMKVDAPAADEPLLVPAVKVDEKPKPKPDAKAPAKPDSIGARLAEADAAAKKAEARREATRLAEVKKADLEKAEAKKAEARKAEVKKAEAARKAEALAQAREAQAEKAAKAEAARKADALAQARAAQAEKAAKAEATRKAEAVKLAKAEAAVRAERTRAKALAKAAPAKKTHDVKLAKAEAKRPSAKADPPERRQLADLVAAVKGLRAELARAETRSKPAEVADARPAPAKAARAAKPARKAALPVEKASAPAARPPAPKRPPPRGEGPLRYARAACASADPGEAMVCADRSLSARERQLQQAYRNAEAAGVPAAALHRQQVRWLAVRAAAAREDRWAVEDVYEARISELNDLTRDAQPN